MRGFELQANQYTQWLIGTADPFWWLVLSLLLMSLAILGIWPLSVREDAPQGDAIRVIVRKVLLLLTTLHMVALPVILASLVYGFSGKQAAAVDDLLGWYGHMVGKYWTAPLAGIVVGILLKFVYVRHITPHLSSWLRKVRVFQTADQQSDIRREITRYQAIDFNPQKHYHKGKVFCGLDEYAKPLYIELADFHSKHLQVIGPTQTGKGVELGVLLDQGIRRGDCVFYIDPKTDKFIPHIMAQACEEAGRPFIYLDLNPDGSGKWAPFTGGTVRDRRARMISAFNLQSRGTDADVYLARERSVVDQLLKKAPPGLGGMAKYVIDNELDERASRLSDGLAEWAEVATFKPRKGRGFSIARSIQENAVVYVRGSISDHLIRDATRIFIMETMQELMKGAGERTHHVTVAVDEVRMVMSQELVDALATVSSFGANIITAYQSILDIRNLPDKTLDARSIEQSVNVNCQLKLLYRAPDFDTAEWGADQSGTVLKTVARMEKTEIGPMGAEKWGRERMLNAVEENLITPNVLLGLQPRVAVLYQPGKLAAICKTCWVPVTKRYDPGPTAADQTQMGLTHNPDAAPAEKKRSHDPAGAGAAPENHGPQKPDPGPRSTISLEEL